MRAHRSGQATGEPPQARRLVREHDRRPMCLHRTTNQPAQQATAAVVLVGRARMNSAISWMAAVLSGSRSPSIGKAWIWPDQICRVTWTSGTTTPVADSTTDSFTTGSFSTLRLQQLLDRGVEGVQVGVQYGRFAPHPVLRSIPHRENGRIDRGHRSACDRSDLSRGRDRAVDQLAGESSTSRSRSTSCRATWVVFM